VDETPPAVPDALLKRAMRFASCTALGLGVLIWFTPLPGYIRVPLSFVPLLAVTPVVRAWHRRRPPA
jgi:hypothetical protein